MSFIGASQGLFYGKADAAMRGLVFDSGVGGLSVTQAIRARLPKLLLDYAADDAFRPYGEKTAAELQARLPELLWSLTHMLGSDFIVLACNTASTTALPAIRAALDIPVIGVVPAIKPAARASQSRHIGVLGTPGTVKRAYVDRLIQDYADDCRVSLKGSVALVAQAENKLAGQGVDMDVITQELSSFQAQTPKVDQIVLACTHFPLLKDEFSAVIGGSVTWVDSGDAIARRTRDVITELEQDGARSPASHPQLAFTTGGDIDSRRQTMFQQYGFSKLLSLQS